MNAVFGHTSGEVAAAYAAGVSSLERMPSTWTATRHPGFSFRASPSPARTADCFSTSVRVPEALSTRFPNDLSPADAAGLNPGRGFNSRDGSFADGLMAVTAGRGVDVLTMDPLDDNRAFIGIDMAQLAVLNGAEIGQLLDRIIYLYRGGVQTPITPSRAFPCKEIQKAFQCLAKGTCIGKIVVDLVSEQAGQGGSLPLTPDEPAPVFRPDRFYIIAGGIGGPGASKIRRIAHHGAWDLAILSRSAGTSARDASILTELRGMGCTRIRGVVHLVMVLADVERSRMTVNEWVAATAPKIAGTWNLHRALCNGGDGGEDFFVLVGSMFGVTGRAGQANYAAANAFLDSLVRFRRGLGLGLLLACEIAQHVLTSLMMADEDGSSMADTSTSAPPASFGMGSLMTIEIRNRWRGVFGVDVTLMQLT
ncbi:Highly reducing polyketide synthase gloL, partial [Colletotrichum shisoi]